ncbi:hypothetical protein IAU60_001797 [Kwoniella sp. DSM 27419]
MSSTAFLAPLRAALRAPRGTIGAGRGLHATVPAMRKRSKAAPEEEAIEEEEDDEDLFATPSSTSSAQTLDKSAIRQSNVARIVEHAKLPAQQRRKDKVSVHALRQVVACSEEEQEVEQIKKVVRAARVGGLPVTKRTASEMIGRLVNLGKPELASELISNRVQFGLPDIDQPTLIKLHHALLTSSQPAPKLPFTQPVSSTLSLLRLSILQQTGGTPPANTGRPAPKVRYWKESKTVQAWAEEARSKLSAAGGPWEDAAKRVAAL